MQAFDVMEGELDREFDTNRDMDESDFVPVTHTPYVSVGSVTKKIMAINPALSAKDIMAIVRAAVQTQGERAGEFAASETIDVERALAIARATLDNPGWNA